MLLLWPALALAQDFHGIRLVDPSGEPFPCAVLETVHHVRWITDADGYAAVYEPGLMDREVWLTPSGSGVQAPVDWLGIAGVAVDLGEGGGTVVTVARSGPSGPCGAGDREQRLLDHGVPAAGEYHELQVIDAATGGPVPAVRITASGRELWTDNGGRVAWFDIDGMDEPVRFDVWTHGYRHDPGYVEVVPAPGGVTTIELDRINVAERLVRLTGGGLWRDSVLLGHPAPLAEPLLSGDVLGQDTAHAVPWRGGLFWLWGDTNRPSYPLGNFHTAGATAALDPTPEDGVDIDYFETAEGFTSEIAPRFAEGPVWLGGLVALSDSELWATYVNVTSDFEVLHEGIVRWDDSAGEFREVVRWQPGDVARPGGPAVRYDGPDGDWVIYRSGHRVPADPVAMADRAAYESYTPLQPDGAGGFTIETDPGGVPVWRWRNDAPAPIYTSPGDGLIPEAASPWHQALEPDTGETPVMHQGTIAWNPWRGRWIHVYTESFGATSLIGEIWYAEGDTPLGPWTWTRKVITHDGYSFYNPYFHPWFASDGGRRVLFEGTYTAWLGTDDPTPRHDYNQQLYALELEDERLALPVAYYDGPDGPAPALGIDADLPQAFGAWDRPVDGAIALRWTAPACADRRLSADGGGEVALWADPLGAAGPDRVPLVEWTLSDGTVRYGVAEPDGATAGTPIATVVAPRWAPPVPLSSFPPPERADAGPDVCGGTSPVTLDGSGSTLAEGVTSWSWSWDGGSAEGETPTVELPEGLHVITLTVAGSSGEAQDTVVVEIGDGSTAPSEPSEPGGEAVGDDVVVADGGGCGCRAVGGAAGWGWSLVLLAVRRRRLGAETLG